MAGFKAYELSIPMYCRLLSNDVLNYTPSFFILLICIYDNSFKQNDGSFCLKYQLLQDMLNSPWLFPFCQILSNKMKHFCYLHSGLLYILICFQMSLSVTFMLSN